MTQNAGDGNPERRAEAGEPAAASHGSHEPVAVTQGAEDTGTLDSRSSEHDKEITALRAEASENWEKYLRAVAELDNLRKRSLRELENTRKFGVERFVSAMLPVRDSIEAALAAAGNAEVPVDVATLVEGERATLRLLEQALEGAGVRQIDPHGEPFDPVKHEAMTVQPSAELPPDTVAMVVQKGYELNERLLRPARVIVSAPIQEGKDQ